MMKEIGSEFHWFEESTHIKGNGIENIEKHCKDFSYTFSGRTAYETIINDMPTKHNVLLPSYCCESMIIPFKKAGYAINFYSVVWDNGLKIDFNIPFSCDVLVLCNFFGFNYNYPDKPLYDFQRQGGIIIEDITHSLFSATPSSYPDADYFIASLRKWDALISGGFCGKKSGTFILKPTQNIGKQYIEYKERAMHSKAKYLENKDLNYKIQFMDLFSKSNELLANGYSNTKIDNWSFERVKSWNISDMRKKRISNATILYDGLYGSTNISMMFSKKNMDSPLFVPVIIPKDKRSIIKEALINNQIYCPIHWPKPNYKCNSLLYDMELSIVCDQRYNEQDMLKIVDVLRKV